MYSSLVVWTETQAQANLIQKLRNDTQFSRLCPWLSQAAYNKVQFLQKFNAKFKQCIPVLLLEHKYILYVELLQLSQTHRDSASCALLIFKRGASLTLLCPFKCFNVLTSLETKPRFSENSLNCLNFFGVIKFTDRFEG